MSDHGEKTEKPSKRKLEKSRKDGSFPVSREFVSALQFIAFTWFAVTWSGQLLSRIQEFTRKVLTQAFHVQVDRIGVVRLYREALLTIFVPILVVGSGLMAITLISQLGTTRFGVSLQKLAPDLKRLNPLKKLVDMPKQGMTAVSQALLLLPLFGYAVYRIAADNFAGYLSLANLSLQPAMRLMLDSFSGLLWKTGFILLLIGVIDYARQVKRHGKSLRMSKQEVKEEMKEAEGNPQIKQRVRRIQRDLARRSMMKEIPKATAVLVNPTHYAVAIRYEMETMAAPRVVAKGKNYLAQRIRQIANDHEVPIIENQPLAQALYKSADVGQEIPPHLYRAVAEILAYLFKLMNQGRR